MFKRIAALLGINKLVPEDLLKKGLEKVDPRFKKFFSESSKYGYPLGGALGFLKSELGQGNQEVDQSLRPDEAANIETKRQQQAPQRVAGAVANIAGGAALGGLGSAALGALTGQDQQAQPEANKESISQSQETPQKQNPGGFQEFIKQNPELGKFLDAEMKKGSSPSQAGQKAKSMRKFKDLIKEIESNIGQSFEDLLNQLFQGSEQAPKQPTNKMAGAGSSQSAIADIIRAHLAKKKGVNG